MNRFNFFILVALIISIIGSTPTLASNCAIKFQHSYEGGVRHGRIDGSQQQDNYPARHRSHLYGGWGVGHVQINDIEVVCMKFPLKLTLKTQNQVKNRLFKNFYSLMT